MALTRVQTKSRDEWKALRKKYIGGSDAAAIVGMNPWSSPYAVWAEKLGKVPEFEGNLETDVGAYLEDFIAKRFEQETGKRVRKENRSIFNDKYPWAIANVDRLIVGEDAGLECKFTDSLNLKRYKHGEYPERFYAQCVHYLSVTGKKRWYLAVLIGNKEFKWFCIERDEEEIATLMQEEESFYRHMVDGTEPPVDGTKATEETIKTIYADSDDTICDLSAFEKDMGMYLEYAKQIKQLESLQKEHANRVKAFMKESGHGLSQRYKVTYSAAEKRIFQPDLFLEDHPDIDLSEYYKISNYRTFKIYRN